MKQVGLGLALLGLCAQAAKLHLEVQGSCDSFQCDLEKGWSPKPEHFKVQGSTNEQCCRPTCRRWKCGHGYKAHPDYFDNVASSNLECCDQLCSSVACNKSYGVPLSKRDALGSTQQECCKPLCSKHVCMGSWATDPKKKNQAGSSNEECCTPSCAALACDSSKGYKYRLERHDRAQPAKNPEDFCCETTCAFFKDQCGRGQGMDEADEVKMKQSATATDFRGKCCEPVCSGVTCPAGYLHHPTKTSYLVSKAHGCCLPTCKAFKCSPGWVKNSVAEPFVSASLRDKDCCLETCALHNCGAGWFNSTQKSKLSKVAASDKACCDSSCQGYQCPAGQVLRSGAMNISSLNADACCESKLCLELRAKKQVKHCNSVSEEAECNKSYDVHEVKRSSAAACAWHAELKLCRMDEKTVLTGCDLK